MNVSTELIQVTCICGCTFAIPYELNEFAKTNGRGIGCPSCKEGFVYGNTTAKENERLKLELQKKDNQLAEERQKLTRLENRIKNGVCPYCRRSFKNVKRHIACKHKAQP